MPIVYACIMPHAPILVPPIGRGIEEETPRLIEAFRDVADRMREARPETVVIISPHGPFRYATIGILTSASVSGSFAEWGHAEIRFEYENDIEFVEAVRSLAQGSEVPLEPLAHWGRGLDWGCLVPLYWLRDALNGARVVPIAVSHALPRVHHELGMCVGDAARQTHRRIAIVCSADLSHALSRDAPAGYDPAGRLFDERYRRAIETWDERWVLGIEEGTRSHAAEDAIPQTALLMGALRGLSIAPRVLAYDAPFGVGYLVASIDVGAPTAATPARRSRR